MHCVIDTYFRELREEGVGALKLLPKRRNRPLWEKGVLGVDTPESLLRAVFYYNGKNFCLRGGKEHRALKLSQIVRHHDPVHYLYTENGSKNRSGSFNQLRLENKSVPVYACAEAGVRCHVAILDKYIGKLPPFALEKDVFYLKPLGAHVATHPLPSPVKLSGMVKAMFSMIGVSGKTNHSLRATGASELFQAGVPEKIVQERTGHRSVKALRLYERTTTNQHMVVSNILAAPATELATDSDTPASSNEEALASSNGEAPSTDTNGGFSISSLIGSATNCVVNINMNHLP